MKSNRPMLLVMRAADMHRAHPQTDWSYCCARCGQPVGVAPSSMLMMRKYAEIELVCQVCDPGEAPFAQLVPGALAEIREAVTITRRLP
jgi:hypothetical protein